MENVLTFGININILFFIILFISVVRYEVLMLLLQDVNFYFSIVYYFILM